MDGYDDSAPNFDSLFSAAENRSYSSVRYSATVNKSVGIILTLILNTYNCHTYLGGVQSVQDQREPSGQPQEEGAGEQHQQQDHNCSRYQT